jgi:hypothetical protein
MKNFDIEVLERTAQALRKYLPVGEYDVYKDFLDVCERLKAKNDSEKQRYRDKAEYHREFTKKWRRDNKERHGAYQKQYYEKKRAEKNKTSHNATDT